MKNRYILWILFFLALVGAANAIKHVIRWHSWQALVFVLIKDLALAVWVTYLYRLSRSSEDQKVITLSVRTVFALLLVSYAADYAIIMLRG
jgi:hypothetical protein